MRDTDLYGQILGVRSPWEVTDVSLRLADGEVEVLVEHKVSEALSCPECGSAATRYDTRRRRWQHLPTCQYRTILVAEVPRVKCREHGVKTVRVPWSDRGSGFTALFEALIIDWLGEASTLAVARRLGLSWDQVDGVMQRAVRRGLLRRELDAQAFLDEHGRVVFKASSGERTIVTEVGGKHLSAFERLPRCPTRFQRYVAGTDVRVHVVGRRTFATEVRTRATDYRYDRGEGARLRATTLDPDLARRCVELAHHLDLYLAGIDLRFGEDGRVYCFEVNPSPAFSYYEEATG